MTSNEMDKLFVIEQSDIDIIRQIQAKALQPGLPPITEVQRQAINGTLNIVLCKAKTFREVLKEHNRQENK